MIMIPWPKKDSKPFRSTVVEILKLNEQLRATAAK